MDRPGRKFAAGALLLAVGALLMPGCKSLSYWARNCYRVGPNHCEPPAPIADTWIDQKSQSLLNTDVQDFEWWNAFQDPALTNLIETAYRQNLSLPTAVARISEARARRNIAAGNLWPQTQQAFLAYARGQIGQDVPLPLLRNFNLWADGFNASWELDFWGRLRRTIESADANVDAAVEDYGDALVLLLSEVATTYVQLRTFEQRLMYARENVQIQANSLGLVQARYEQGLVTELDLRQARASLSQTQATIPPLDAGRRVASNQLCTLLGMPVHDLAEQLPAGIIPTAPPQVAIGIPADLLRKRPDIRRAERRVAAQCAQIGVAEADFYPRIAINGFIGYAANDFRGMFDASNLTGIILPTLQWNILNYGRITNNVRAQEALLEATTLQYQQTVLDAGREVEDALVQFIQAQRQAAVLAESVSDSRRAVEVAQDQFRGGVADFNRVYTNQSLLVGQQDLLATAHGNIALYLIQVYRAMGGGWQYFCQGYSVPPVEAGVAVAPEALPPAPPKE